MRALQEVKRRLRLEWPSRSASVAASDAQLNHLVARALAQAGVIRYLVRVAWQQPLHGTRWGDLHSAALSPGAAAYLRQIENPALANRR